MQTKMLTPILCDNQGNQRSRTHKNLKERFLIRRNRTKRAIFRESLLFQVPYNNKTTLKTTTDKQTINSTYFVSVGCGRLAEEKGHETDFPFRQPSISN